MFLLFKWFLNLLQLISGVWVGFFFFLYYPPVCLLAEGAIKGRSEDLLI